MAMLDRIQKSMLEPGQCEEIVVPPAHTPTPKPKRLERAVHKPAPVPSIKPLTDDKEYAAIIEKQASLREQIRANLARQDAIRLELLEFDSHGNWGSGSSPSDLDLVAMQLLDGVAGDAPLGKQKSLLAELQELVDKAAPFHRALEILDRQKESAARRAGARLGDDFESKLSPLYRKAAMAAAKFDAAVIDLKTAYEAAKSAGYFMSDNPFAGGRFDSRDGQSFFAQLLDELYERGFLAPGG
jgi:hypothetical protein